MDVLIDNEIGFEPDENQSLVLDVILKADEQLRKEARTVFSITINGNPLNPDDAGIVLKDMPVSKVNILEITSESIMAVVESLLADLENVLPELPNACHALAEIFQSETPEDGYEPFRQLAEIWENIKYREMRTANTLGISLDSIQINGRSFFDMHQELNSFLHEAADAIEAHDGILLGDLLEYELAQRAEEETKIIAYLREQAQKLFGDA